MVYDEVMNTKEARTRSQSKDPYQFLYVTLDNAEKHFTAQD